MLPEQSAEQIAVWWQAHPGIEVLARDRATRYAEALEQGAPEAHQVADRWHLLQNLGTVLPEMRAHNTAARRAVARALTEQRRPEQPLADPRDENDALSADRIGDWGRRQRLVERRA